MFTAPALTLLLLAIVVGLGIALVWMLWEIEQMSKPRPNSDRSGEAAIMRGHVSEKHRSNGRKKESRTQREKRDHDLQLDEELEGTFPASDPPKITRAPVKSRCVAYHAQTNIDVPRRIEPS
jgi:hypothetical protein